MDAMDLVWLLRIGLHGIALVLGSLGIFCLYWSCLGAPTAAYAFVCLSAATAITLAADSQRPLSR
jgi:hypothetical protein